MTAEVQNSSVPGAALARLADIGLLGYEQYRTLAERPTAWAWDGYAAAGTIVTIAGPSSGGKTTLVALILIARAWCGEPLELLGRCVTPASEGQYVLLIENEHGEASIARKLIKATGLLGIDPEPALDRVLTMARKNVKIGDPVWEEIKRLTAAGFVSDIALDTLARSSTADANSEREQTAIFAEIAALIEGAPAERHPTVWVLAHTRKSGAEALEDVSGSTARIGQSDSVIMVAAQRDDAGQVTSSVISLVKSREDADPYPGAMTLTLGPQLVATNGRPAKATKARKCPPDKVAAVRGYIEAQGSTVTGHIAEELRMSKETVCAAMRELETEGYLVSNRKLDGKVTGWSRA